MGALIWKPVIGVILFVLLLTGCEDTNLNLATQAGMDVVRAVTLSEKQVRLLAGKAAGISDRKHRVAGPASAYARRLKRLVPDFNEKTGFNIKAYIDSQVNAFAMADGSIRIYSGLMARMADGELLFVIGHEMGHVIEKHVRKKMMVALAASALRKGIASQENMAGFIASSALGGFAQDLANAQFSQQEEQAADAFGLEFLKQNGFSARRAVDTAARALEKLAGSSGNHSLLSSHPSPYKRAKRIREAQNQEELSLVTRLWVKAESGFDTLKHKLWGGSPKKDTKN